MEPYFKKTTFDNKFYKENISTRLPDKIFDSHMHINLSEHVNNIPECRIKSDWALECGHILPVQDAYKSVKDLYPDAEYYISGFPWPIKEADIKGNNRYLAKERKKGTIFPFMSVRPKWDLDYIENTLLKGKFVGFKPYPDMVSGVKGADISIFDFMPHKQWKLLNKYKKAVMLHLPRKKRLADENNIKELLEARHKYPETTIIIAHFGRAFCPYYLREGLKKMGGDTKGFYFDNAGVINPEVYDLAFSKLSLDKILYGSDLPIFFWHGKREWTKKDYKNLSRENFSWKEEFRPPEVEEKYTLFIYEHMKAILDACDRNKISDKNKKNMFFYNTIRALNLKNIA